MNFLNERNAARGMMVKQYDDRILLKHMKKLYGTILSIIILFMCFLPCEKKIAMITSLCIPNVWIGQRVRMNKNQNEDSCIDIASWVFEIST